MPKKPVNALGTRVPSSERNVVERLSRALAGDMFAPDPLLGAESSEVETRADTEGAALLYEERKEGTISSLGIVLIPNENKQDRRIAAVSDAFGFVAYLNNRQWMAVLTPKGYVTDFASIPSFAQWLISPFGKHSEAAVVHDWLYTLGKPGDEKGRRLADKTFRRALKLVGVGPVRRNIMYFSVRAGGKKGYGLASDFDFRSFPGLLKSDPMPIKERLRVTVAPKTFSKKRKEREQEQAPFLAPAAAKKR